MKLLKGPAPQVAQGLLTRGQRGRALVARGIARGESKEVLIDELTRGLAALGLAPDELVIVVWDGTAEAEAALGELNRARDLLLQSARLVVLVADDEAGLRAIQTRALDLLAYLDLGFEVQDEQTRRIPAGAVGPVRILHLSDLHARTKTEWDARVILGRLVNSVHELGADGLAPDLVVITGDVAHSGKDAEYSLVEDWFRDGLLPATGLGPEALFIVPGNHDVDRTACTSLMVQALEQAITQGDQDRVAAVLEDKAQLRLVYQRYKSYLNFLRRLGVPHEAKPFWRHRVEVRGVVVRFAGLDTAWLASKDAVQGRLVLGLAQVNRTLPALGTGDDDLVVALSHHPITELVDWDRSVVQATLRARAHVHLRGHLHNPDFTLARPQQHRLIELPAGACYASHAAPMSFQLVELDPARGKVRANRRIWSAEWNGWVPDRNRLPPHGTAEFDLR